MNTRLHCAVVAVVGGLAASVADAGLMHARSIIGLGVHAQFASHHGVAHAVRNQGSKYRVSHAQKGSIYTYGNAGNGHAEHHGGSHLWDEQFDAVFGGDFPPPIRGEPGNSQDFGLGWHPNEEGTHITVSWNQGGFLQVDLHDVATPGDLVLASASISIDEMVVGTVELRGGGAARGGGDLPVVLTRTGLFEAVQFEIIPHGGGIFSASPVEPPLWVFAGSYEEFSPGVDGEVVPAPGTAALLVLAVAGASRRRRRAG